MLILRNFCKKLEKNIRMSDLKSFVKNYNPYPTLKRFHLSEKRYKGVMGVPGSGKTTACFMEIIRQAKLMPQNYNKGNKRCSRWAIIRDTYPNLEQTTLRTCLELFPEAIFGKVYRKYPIIYKMQFDDVELELLFLALSSEDDYSKLRSLELTGIYANELCTLPQLIFEEGAQRIGRMPSLDDVPNYNSSIIFDTNPPMLDSWQARMFENPENPNFEVFKQPPALILDENGDYILNPAVENVRHDNESGGGVTAQYYLDMLYTKSPAKFRMLALNQYGLSEEGLPCWQQYNDNIHYVDYNFEANPSYPLLISLDFGTSPAALITQKINGQIRCLHDFVGQYTNLREFLTSTVLPLLKTKYAAFTLKVTGDPAGRQNPGTDGFTHIQIAKECLGKDVALASTNSIDARLDAVGKNLSKLVNGQPGLVVSKSCPLLRKALAGDYQYERLRVLNADGTTTYKDKPLKNMSSHIADALQYACLYYNGEDINKVANNFAPNSFSPNWMAN